MGSSAAARLLSVDPVAIALCRRCRKEILPAEPKSSLISGMHRAAARGMVEKPDAKAERIKRRKAAKAALRAIVAGKPAETSEAVTLYLKTTVAPPPPEECPDCLALQKMQSGPRAQFLGYDPTTHRAYARLIPER